MIDLCNHSNFIPFDPSYSFICLSFSVQSRLAQRALAQTPYSLSRRNQLGSRGPIAIVLHPAARVVPRPRSMSTISAPISSRPKSKRQSYLVGFAWLNTTLSPTLRASFPSAEAIKCVFWARKMRIGGMWKCSAPHVATAAIRLSLVD